MFDLNFRPIRKSFEPKWKKKLDEKTKEDGKFASLKMDGKQLRNSICMWRDNECPKAGAASKLQKEVSLIYRHKYIPINFLYNLCIFFKYKTVIMNRSNTVIKERVNFSR